MVSVGVGSLLNLVCVDELGAMFWQHLVILEAPDPHGGPFRVFMEPSHSRTATQGRGVLGHLPIFVLVR
jgi:hypothetical protein